MGRGAWRKGHASGQRVKTFSARIRTVPKPVVICREMIGAAALNLLLESGASALSVRSVPHALGSSPKPIYRTYGSMEGLRECVAELVREYMRDQIYSNKRAGNALLDAGIGHVMNAVNNRHLFHFNYLHDTSLERGSLSARPIPAKGIRPGMTRPATV